MQQITSNTGNITSKLHFESGDAGNCVSSWVTIKNHTAKVETRRPLCSCPVKHAQHYGGHHGNLPVFIDQAR